jgi:hypothetical protein
MHVRRLIPVARVEEEAVWAAAEDRRHRDKCTSRTRPNLTASPHAWLAPRLSGEAPSMQCVVRSNRLLARPFEHGGSSAEA